MSPCGNHQDCVIEGHEIAPSGWGLYAKAAPGLSPRRPRDKLGESEKHWPRRRATHISPGWARSQVLGSEAGALKRGSSPRPPGPSWGVAPSPPSSAPRSISPQWSDMGRPCKACCPRQERQGRAFHPCSSPHRGSVSGICINGAGVRWEMLPRAPL